MHFALLFTWILAATMVPGWAQSALGSTCIPDGLAASTPQSKSVRRQEEKLAKFEKKRQTDEKKSLHEQRREKRRADHAMSASIRAHKGGPLSKDEFWSMVDAEAYFKEKGMTPQAKQLTERLRPERQKRQRIASDSQKMRAKTIEMETLPDGVILSPRAEQAMKELDADAGLARHAKAARSTIHQLMRDPNYPSLRTKKLAVGGKYYGGVDISAGDVFQSYASHGDAGAYRILWRYRSDGSIIILNVTPHP